MSNSPSVSTEILTQRLELSNAYMGSRIAGLATLSVRYGDWLGSFLLEAANEPIVFTVMTDPEPYNIRSVFNCCGSIMDANSG